MPNSAIIAANLQNSQAARDYVKQLLKKRGATVQMMCDETGLVKSTVDKWLAGQTADTSFGNVRTMLNYLGGSLDVLMSQATPEAAAPPAPASAPAEKRIPINAEYPALALLVESYEKEIHRIGEHHQQEIQRTSAVHEKYLAHVVELVETGRQALITQHANAILHTKALCETALEEKQHHLLSFKAGRNVWRGVSLVEACVLLGIAVWLVWEFSNLSSGLTGYLLRQAGYIAGTGGLI